MSPLSSALDQPLSFLALFSPVNLGKWVLRYLFEGFVTAELLAQEEEQQNYRNIQNDVESQQTARASSTSLNDQAAEPQTPNIKVTPLPAPAPIPTTSNGFSNSSNQPTDAMDLSQLTTHSGAATAPAPAFARQDYFSGGHHDSPPSTPLIQAPPPAAFATNLGPLSPTTGGFMGRLRNLSVKAKLGRTPSSEAKMEGGMMSSLGGGSDNLTASVGLK